MGWKTITLFFGWGKEGYLMTLSVSNATQHQIKGLLLNDKYERICKKSCPGERERGGEMTTKTLIPDNQLYGQVFNHAPPKYTCGALPLHQSVWYNQNSIKSRTWNISIIAPRLLLEPKQPLVPQDWNFMLPQAKVTDALSHTSTPLQFQDMCLFQHGGNFTCIFY